MIRNVLLAAFGVALVAGGCTLLLPTNEIIKPCTNNDECDEGFTCEQNACLPEDAVDDSGSDSG